MRMIRDRFKCDEFDFLSIDKSDILKVVVYTFYIITNRRSVSFNGVLRLRYKKERTYVNDIVSCKCLRRIRLSYRRSSWQGPLGFRLPR